MTPDSEESGDTEGKSRREDESEIVCTDLSEKEKLEILKEIHDSPYWWASRSQCISCTTRLISVAQFTTVLIVTQ
jgi:hypothetical protein